MAQLSERDRRILLGDNFAEIEQRAVEESRAAVTPEEKLRKAERQRLRNADNRFNAVGVLVAGVLIAWGAYRSTHAINTTADVGLALALAGICWISWLVLQGKSLDRAIQTFKAS